MSLDQQIKSLNCNWLVNLHEQQTKYGRPKLTHQGIQKIKNKPDIRLEQKKQIKNARCVDGYGERKFEK